MVSRLCFERLANGFSLVKNIKRCQLYSVQVSFFLQAGGEGSDDVMSVMRKILQRQTELEAVLQKQQVELEALRAKQQAGTSS